eukprot:6205339-Pleurochrysis_carterae.AAC.4
MQVLSRWELAEVLQRWAEEGFKASHRRSLELGEQLVQAVGLSAANAASLVQKTFKGKMANIAGGGQCCALLADNFSKGSWLCRVR